MQTISKRGILNSLAAAATIAGVASAIGIQFESPLAGAVSFVALVALIAPFVWLRERRSGGVDIEGVLDEYTIHVGYNQVVAAHARRLAETAFGDHLIPSERTRSIHGRGGGVLLSVYEGPRIAAYADFFFVEPLAAQRLINGEIDERDLAAAETLPVDQWAAGKLDRYVYFAGVVVTGSDYQRGCRLQRIVWAAVRELHSALTRAGDQRGFVAISTSSTDAGRRLLERLGFEFTKTDTELGPVMLRQVDQITLTRLSDALPDFSKSFSPLDATASHR